MVSGTTGTLGRAWVVHGVGAWHVHGGGDDVVMMKPLVNYLAILQTRKIPTFAGMHGDSRVSIYLFVVHSLII